MAASRVQAILERLVSVEMDSRIGVSSLRHFGWILATKAFAQRHYITPEFGPHLTPYPPPGPQQNRIRAAAF
jgi:hypothetical protein